jgi:hypothetical protein
MAPTITIDGVSISPASGVSQNFAFLVPYTVSAEDGSAAQWIVTVKWAPLAPTANIGTYLGSASGGGTADDPIPLSVSVDLPDGWTALLTAIDNANKYVALDLSACTMTNTEFDPGYTISTGKNRIASLILPDAATSIAAGTFSDSTFKNFTALKSVTGGAVTNVSDYAFISYDANNCDALETVSLPVAITIGEWAFVGCDALKTVNLPAATSIGAVAFAYCTALTSVNISAVTNIGIEAFYGCSTLMAISLPTSLESTEGNPFPGCTSLTAITIDAQNPNYKAEGGKLLSKDGKTLIGWPTATGNITLPGITILSDESFSYATLTSVTLPAATTIGRWAFTDCTALTTVDLPVAVTIGLAAFSGCTALTTVDLPVTVTIGLATFSGCTGLTAVNLPVATSIGDNTFYGCTALETVDLPAATSINVCAFAYTGTTASLTVTLGDTPPVLRTGMFDYITDTKSVTVKVPTGATAWNGKTGTFSGSENTTDGPHWGESFRGRGWTSGGAYESNGAVNTNISLTIETY